MSQDAGVLDLTFKAGEDLDTKVDGKYTKQYCFVKLNSDGDVILSDGAGSVSIGILQNAPADEKAARVRLLGTSKLVMAEACPAEGPFGQLNKGALITSDTAGKGVKADTNEFSGAIALEAATDAGEIIEVIVTHMYAPSQVSM